MHINVIICDTRVYEYTMIIYYRRYDLPMCIYMYSKLFCRRVYLFYDASIILCYEVIC